ncbi:MAG: hypothetical protein ACR2PL_15795 [Dehalococcoidia bacterium]
MDAATEQLFCESVEALDEGLYHGAQAVIAGFNSHNRYDISGTAKYLDEAIQQLSDARAALQQVVKLAVLAGVHPSELAYREQDASRKV